MKTQLWFALAAVLAVAGCGGSEDGEDCVSKLDGEPLPCDDSGAVQAEDYGQGDRLDRSPAPGGSERGGARLRVTNVIDGDTVDTDRLGRVRLIGVDAPEEGRCYENAATRFTRARIGGELVRYELGEERKDPYGRTLAYLYVRGRMHNLALLRGGYATTLTIPPNDKYLRVFRRAERRARRRDDGRWGRCDDRRRRPRPPSIPSPPHQNDDRPSVGLPPPPPDLDCSDVGGPVPVGPGDPHALDGDGDGIGCD